MGYNSNNWATEASLRNERRIKADSMSALLDHVEWNHETLEIKIDGVTLNWGDVEGADSKVTKITEDTVHSMYIIADSIEASNITSSNIWGRPFGFKFSDSEGFFVGYVGSDDTYKSNVKLTKDDYGSGAVEIEGHQISLTANRRIDISATSGVYINEEPAITSGTISTYLSDYMPKAYSRSTSAPSFFRPVGFTNSSHTSVGYMTKSEMQKWLEIA